MTLLGNTPTPDSPTTHPSPTTSPTTGTTPPAPQSRLARRTTLAALAAATAAFAVAACSKGEDESDRLTIAAGEPGGFYLEFAQLLAAQLNLAGVAKEVVVLPTLGSKDNLRLLQDRKTDLALSLADAVSPNPQVKALGRVYENYLQCVVRADSTYKTLADLAGTRISAGAAGSGAALTAARILTTVGVDCTVDHLLLEQATKSLESRGIAAMFWSGGVPTSTLDKLSQRVPLRLIPLDGPLPALRRTYGPVYQDVRVPAGVYRGTAPVKVVGIPNLLLCRPDLPAATARRIVETLVRRASNLVPPSAVGAQFLNLQSLVVSAPIDLHTGAIQQYRRMYG
ncbi:TAXI family TRAP transporter solute-binding subunit [Kribbella ginsengisoli]|uniref:TAXI family TRAP transporter solute-binding subunit n=1 Tax=Kribbella ginsengisoli TaxID=363865 RepID=A0ABP6WG39_9ACTN